MASRAELEQRIQALQLQVQQLQASIPIEAKKAAEAAITGFKITGTDKIKVTGSGKNISIGLEPFTFSGSGQCVDGGGISLIINYV